MNKNLNTKSLLEDSKEIRKTVLNMIVEAHASHIASSYSIVEILNYLYTHVLNVSAKDPLNPNRDRFILSKGWGVAALYAVLAKKGFFSKELLESYCKDGSKLIGIGTLNGLSGIEATTGSMGHGLPLGVGMALAMKRQKRKSRVFVVISDGECDEGSTWEAILQAGHHKLDNLTVIVDYNKWQSYGRVADVLDLEPFFDKWKSFKWSPYEINGHDYKELDTVFSKLSFNGGKPNVIIANTIKGKGVSVLENRNEWHYRTPQEKEIAIANEELK